jgi:hypothetical protein
MPFGACSSKHKGLAQVGQANRGRRGLPFLAVSLTVQTMKELLRTTDIVVISALKAALSAEGIEAFEFDGDIASIYAGIDSFPRRLMVRTEDFDPAAEVARALCPDHVQ